jgi:hypothetical protein
MVSGGEEPPPVPEARATGSAVGGGASIVNGSGAPSRSAGALGTLTST